MDCPKRLYDTLSSFSNQDSGGVLLFGIDETVGFQAVGVYDAQDLQKKVTEQCNQMEPPVRAVFTLAEVDGNWICAAEIPAADLAERPCYYRGAGRIKGSYVRVGDADLPMTDYELYSYEAFRHHLHDDERPVERAELSMLDADKLERYTFCQTPRTRREIADYLGVKTVFYAMGHYVQPLLQAGKLAMTLPETPKSSKQKFYTV